MKINPFLLDLFKILSEMKFSQRIGKIPVQKVIQINSIDRDLLNTLWNIVKLRFIDPVIDSQNYSQEFETFCRELWAEFLKRPIDTLPVYDPEEQILLIKSYFFKTEWYHVYDFIEFIINSSVGRKFNKKSFINICNYYLEKENSGYRIVKKQFVPITNVTEIEEIENAMSRIGQFSSIENVNIHLTQALTKLSDKANPDYRNSIKESISAVEGVAKVISGGKNDTLGAALDKIKGKANIHPSLERGFKHIYGYTSDGDGIRHALMEEPTCGLEDARFMLVACSAFINYLLEKANKDGINLT